MPMLPARNYESEHTRFIREMMEFVGLAEADVAAKRITTKQGKISGVRP